METQKVHFKKERETLLLTLYAKAVESRSEGSILKDRFAARVLDRIDYDFGKLKANSSTGVSLAIRAKMLDSWTRRFLAQHATATILHLGCGLDTRVFRVDPVPGVSWYDVDFPDVIALRRNLYPERDGYHLIASSVTESHWLHEVPVDRPIMIVAEGLL